MDDYSRLNAFWSTYYYMASYAMERFQKLCKNTVSFEKDPDEYFDTKELKFYYGTQVIIFAAMSLEALINDFGASELGDSYFRNHVDKLDTVSKYLVIIKMVHQKEFPKESQAYELLKNLFRIRNKMVHSKSKAIPYKENGDIDIEMYQKKIEGSLSNWEETVTKSFETINECSKMLSSLIPEELIFLLFKSVVAPTNTIPILPHFNECLEKRILFE
ncbi:MAG: hypothetical protein GF353_02090 [Candidatus Lokiarchaeota archaeon]|nr:hypothetical protein [Candidatus Lokiarchaeota archaeon]